MKVEENKYVSKNIFKRILSVFVIGVMFASFASCGADDGKTQQIGGGKKLQETTVITRHVSEKYSGEIAFDSGIGFVKGGVRLSGISYKGNGGVELTEYTTELEYSDDGFNLSTIPSSVISVGKYVFYLNEERELHRVNTESKSDEIIANMQTNAQNIIYSDYYMIIYGTQDESNYKYFLYDIKNEEFVENEIINNIFSDSGNTAFAALLEDKLFYVENAQYGSRNSVLKYCKLTDYSIVDVYVCEEEKEEYISGVASCDPENNCLYYCVDYFNYDEKADGGKYSWKLIKYNNETGESEKQYNAITMDYTKDEVYVPATLSSVFAVGGKLYGYLQAEPGIDGGEIFEIVEGELKTSETLPVGEKLYVEDGYACYKSKEKNIFIKKDRVLSISETINEKAGFLGCFNEGLWYSTEKHLCVLNEENLKIEEKVMFNGFIISATEEYFICYGKPIEKHDITGPYGDQSSTFKECKEGVYKVSINETEQEEIVRDVFVVSDDDKSEAVSILDEIHGLEIMTLVSSPVITANDTTYEEGVVSVTVSGKFRMAEDLWVEKTTVFTVNLSTKTCGTSELWDSVVNVYNSGY